MIVKRGVVLFASDDSADSVTDAKDYIKRFALSSELVKLIKIEDQTQVVVKKEFNLERR